MQQGPRYPHRPPKSVSLQKPLLSGLDTTSAHQAGLVPALYPNSIILASLIGALPVVIWWAVCGASCWWLLEGYVAQVHWLPDRHEQWLVPVLVSAVSLLALLGPVFGWYIAALTSAGSSVDKAYGDALIEEACNAIEDHYDVHGAENGHAGVVLLIPCPGVPRVVMWPLAQRLSAVFKIVTLETCGSGSLSAIPWSITRCQSLVGHVIDREWLVAGENELGRGLSLQRGGSRTSNASTLGSPPRGMRSASCASVGSCASLMPGGSANGQGHRVVLLSWGAGLATALAAAYQQHVRIAGVVNLGPVVDFCGQRGCAGASRDTMLNLRWVRQLTNRAMQRRLSAEACNAASPGTTCPAEAAEHTRNAWAASLEAATSKWPASFGGSNRKQRLSSVGQSYGAGTGLQLSAHAWDGEASSPVPRAGCAARSVVLHRKPDIALNVRCSVRRELMGYDLLAAVGRLQRPIRIIGPEKSCALIAQLARAPRAVKTTPNDAPMYASEWLPPCDDPELDAAVSDVCAAIASMHQYMGPLSASELDDARRSSRSSFVAVLR